jgi:predicted deacylase
VSALEIRDAPARTDVPADVDAFLDGLSGPTVFRLAGRDRSRVRAVVGMLHGNEPSGLRAIHTMLREGEMPATDALLFIGAVEAARLLPRHGHRFVPGRRDLNRCFAPPFEGPDGAIAGAALAVLTPSALEASVDLHNNTGHNPAYGVGSTRDPRNLALTSLWATRYVVSNIVLGSCAEALSAVAPAITVECGRAGDRGADEVAIAGLSRFLSAERLLDRPPPAIETLEALVRVCIRPDVSLMFDERPHPEAGLTLDADIDRHNFQQLSVGTRIGWVRGDAGWPIVATDAAGADISRRLFAIEGDALVSRSAIIPIMMTTNAAAARADCLFYVVEREG